MDIRTVIKGLEVCVDRVPGKYTCDKCPYETHGNDCEIDLTRDAIALLKKQVARELTMDEWREWKANPKRDPICMLWENDTSPIWVLDPNDIHEPAFLMRKLKLFTGKPTFERCKKVKWE